MKYSEIDLAYDDNDENLIDDRALLVINKIDLSDNILHKIQHFKLKNMPILISLKEKINLDDLILALENKVKELLYAGSSAPITRERYRKSLNVICENLSHFSLKKNIEFAAEDLRLSIREIGKITGKVEVDDILDIIFKGFCIGTLQVETSKGTVKRTTNTRGKPRRGSQQLLRRGPSVSDRT